MAEINNDPTSYHDVVSGAESKYWIEPIASELKAIEDNKVWKLVARPGPDKERNQPNIIDSRWVFKSKINGKRVKVRKARLVIRGFKDLNEYDLKETYAPVSRLPLVRALLSIADAYNLEINQLDVKAAFYMEILINSFTSKLPTDSFLMEKNLKI